MVDLLQKRCFDCYSKDADSLTVTVSVNLLSARKKEKKNLSSPSQAALPLKIVLKIYQIDIYLSTDWLSN